jgi:hydrogenase expression/formation protein HypC
MCLAIPGKVEEIVPKSDPLMGIVDFGGVKKEVCFELVPDVHVGEYVAVHVGFALNTIDEVDAQETLALLLKMGEADQQI